MKRKYLIPFVIICLGYFCPVQKSYAGGRSASKLYNLPTAITNPSVQANGGAAVDFPDVPRISAYEAYLKYKSGQAILLHGGGNAYENRHIVGAIDTPSEEITHERMSLPDLPYEGMEIYTYCY